ncbi:hypothetical protein [Marimonas arenosa]|uniref:DUF1127 domain-containing protein n=1 Tax=Marimonas arenosa TaxID=1795305 RepID=A0AAE3WFD8_9RHOB|nr:hypothetical protein [Marimonas arenosa]MDQ2092006.1 hypothetical protein [Marimonas arenosa]
MTDITSQFSFSDRPRSGYERMFASLLRGMNAYADARSRRDRIAALEAKSDAELARLGLKRDQIAYHVFRDMFYV